MYAMNQIKASTTEEITYDKFVELLETGEIDKVEINADTGKLTITPKEQPYENYTLTYYTGLLEDGNFLQQR